MNVMRSYGWIPDVPDQRDYLFKQVRPRLKLPPRIDLRDQCSPIEDQGALGSCTAQALAGNMEFLDYRDDHVHTDLSRLFIYYNERVMIDSVSYDSGATLRDGIKTLNTHGVCKESSWPYIIEKFTKKPTPKCYKEAKPRRILSYYRIETLQEMFECLADKYPFVFGIALYESFHAKNVSKTGKVPMPKPGERMLGGHAVMAVGYDCTTKRFLVRNSWGAKWGLRGYFTLPFSYLETLAADFWTIRR